jgi:DNA-binding NarL/FixJ family response regulator
VLAQDPALELVGESRSGREAVELASRLCPDLVLMDIGMPDMDGLNATSALKRNNPTTSVLILTMHDDADLLLNALRAGAAGYMLKTANEPDLRVGIREALAGELPIDRNMTRQVLERLADRQYQHAVPATIDRLSAREHEVLALVTRGYSNRAIAEELILRNTRSKRMWSTSSPS